MPQFYRDSLSQSVFIIYTIFARPLLTLQNRKTKSSVIRCWEMGTKIAGRNIQEKSLPVFQLKRPENETLLKWCKRVNQDIDL